MNSSGIKRGLATTAVSALAVAGIPFIATSASAVPMNQQVETANSVYLVGPDGAVASTANDGVNTTIRLQAVGGTGVAQVRFSYNFAGGAQQTIATVGPNDNGSFSFEWAAANLSGAAVTITATGVSAAGADLTADTQAVTISSTTPAVNVADGDAVGVFLKPDYDGAGPATDGVDAQGQPDGSDDAAAQIVGLNGTSSAKAAVPADLRFWDDDTAAGTAGNQPGFAGTSTVKDTAAADAERGQWAGLLDITGYNYGSNNQLLVKATLANGNDDTEAYNLYQQQITAVTAVAKSGNIPAGSSTPVTVTVTDQNGRPVTGAEVRDSDGALIGQTDGNGQIEAAQGAGSKFYYANATASNPFEAELGDKRSEAVTVAQYQAVPNNLEATSPDGPAFDFDEGNTVTVQVKDQNGNDLNVSDEQDLRYYWKVTEFDGTVTYYGAGNTPSPTAPATQAAYNEATTDTDGEFTVSLPAADDATYELFGALEADAFGNNAISVSKLLEVKAGEADIVFDESSPEQAAAGTSEDVTGQLVLADGTPLAGRRVTGTYSGGTDAGVVQADGTSAGSRTVTTGANGQFSFTVKDPAVASGTQPTESGTFTVETVNTPNIGDADADNSTTIEFRQSVTPGFVTISPEVALATTKTPGRPVTSTVKLTTGDLDPNTTGNQTEPLSNQEVTLTVDEGFFVEFKDANSNGPELNELTADPAPAVGADFGEFKSLGQSIVVKTDSNGEADFVVAIERNDGFDDDGRVDATVTATIGTLSDTEVVDWTSANPLNPGAVRIEESPAAFQESKALPSAQVGQTVYFEVYTEDQFGNLVGNESVDLSENGPFSSITDEDGDAITTVVSDFIDDIDFQATATRPNTQRITSSWTQPGTNYTAVNGATATANETVTDTYTIDWYALDFETSEFSITQSPEGNVAVGSPVTETVKVVDENGNPVAGLRVEFIRQGAGSSAGGDAAVVTFTNANGEAFYTFTGTEAGTATVSAFITDGTQTQTLTDTVTFVAGGGEEPGPIDILISGDDNGGAKDVVRVLVTNGDGETLKLFKIRGTQAKGNKRLVEVRDAVVPEGGNMTFKVRDANGPRKTRFVAKITSGGETFKSNTQKLR